MDREQEEVQFLGFFGIFKESANIILSWRRIFTQITLSLIFPLTFITFAQILISHAIFSKIEHNENTRDHTRPDSASYSKISDLISAEWAAFFAFKFAYFTVLLIFSLLSTSAVVYTIASVYTAKPVAYSRVMAVVPKVWKRLMVTFLWSFAVVFAYNIVSVVVMVVWIALFEDYTLGIAVTFLLAVAYAAGLLYITVVWHLASVVSVLEDTYGIKAMRKSRDLVKGKLGIACGVFVVIGIGFSGIQFVFKGFVASLVFGWPHSVWIRVLVGIVCFLVMVMVILMALVLQTVVYFVCKSFHHENIDKSSLADHLEVYLLGEYVPLKGKDVQMEHFEV